MVVNNHGLSWARDEQISERGSEVTSMRSDEPSARLDDILNWIDGIPLTKTFTRNIARDFSDAVLMSEILKFYYPHLVTAHNYIPSNSIQGKRDNWNVLNRKVLAKIDMRLSPETIEQLIHSQNGVIEKVLLDFHDKQRPNKIKLAKVRSATDLDNATSSQLTIVLKKDQDEQKRKSTVKSSFGLVIYLIVGIFKIFMAILCFWKWFSKTSNVQQRNHTEATSDDRETDMRDAYLKSLEDLDRSYEAVKTLRHKVAFLEGTIKLKDAKIAGLQNDLDNRQHHRTADVVHSARLSFDNGHRSIRRPRV